MCAMFVPPIKIQGIKTKLLPLIHDSLSLKNGDVWIEPFMGSGVVGFNLAPKRAIFADTNPHTIAFYNAIQNREITSNIVHEFLNTEGKLLLESNGEYYYTVRSRFNKNKDPLDFLFLNRSCFNGMIRFNRYNEFNVPFGKKPERFAKAYITKIVHQVEKVEAKFAKNDWEFRCQSFEKTIGDAQPGAFIYCDPPYIGRHVDYYDSWDMDSEIALKDALLASGCKFMLSTWDHNDYRKNECVDTIWNFCNKITKEHFYFVGAKESNRNPIIEALMINYPIPEKSSKDIDDFMISSQKNTKTVQLTLGE